MNFNLSIPFIKISFLNANIYQKSFFDTLFFHTEFKTETLLNVHITFAKTTPTITQHTLENNCFRNDNNFYILDTKKNKCKVNLHSFTKNNINLEVEEGFDLYYLFTFLIEPLLIIWASTHKLLFIHSSGIAKEKKISIFPAWRNTGKTNTILEYCKDGYDFCGDDFCLIYGSDSYLYPKTLNLFSYNLSAFPMVYDHLPKPIFMRLKITLLIKKFLYNLSQITNGGLSKVLYRISELAEISTNIKVNPKQLHISVCNKGELTEIILLQKSNERKQITKKIDTDLAIKKILQTIKYELKDFFELYSKYLFLFPDKTNRIIDTFDINYEKLLISLRPQFKIRLLSKGST